MRDLRDDIRDAFEHDHAATTVALARRWLEDDPQDWQVWGWYGTMLYQMARYDEAVAALEKKIEHIPPQGLVYAYCRMGHLYRYRGDYPQAETWYQKAIDYDPTDATAYIYLGAALARQGKLREAESAHRAGTRCEDGCIDEAYHNLGLVLRGQGRLREARECFVKAVEMDPEYADALEALDDVNIALMVGPDDATEQDAVPGQQSD